MSSEERLGLVTFIKTLQISSCILQVCFAENFAMEHQGITLSESTDNIDGPGTRLKLNVNFDVIDPDKVPVLENPVKNPVWKVFVFSFSTACSWFAL